MDKIFLIESLRDKSLAQNVEALSGLVELSPQDFYELRQGFSPRRSQ